MSKQEKQPNYTAEQEARLLEAVPFDYEGAKALADELGKGPKSIVAKIKRMENDESIEGDRPFYQAQEAYTPKTGKPVEKKSEIVTSLETLLDVESGTFKGLDKAPKSALEKVREAVRDAASSEGAENEQTEQG